MLKKITFFLPIVLALAVWGFFYSYEAKNFEKNLQYPCVSYAPYNITQKDSYQEKELRTDLLKIKKISNCVRVYGVTNGLEQIPRIAEDLGMEVIIGAWLDEDKELNEMEIANLVKVAQNSTNIKYVIVGNETLLMQRVDEKYLYKNLDMVRKLVKQPVTTTEAAQVWLVYPELEDHVDFIGLHKFPYWEETGFEYSLYSMQSILEMMQEKFTKPVVVLEIGWPTNGVRQGDAIPGLITQRKYLKETGDYLKSQNIFYNVAEGIDVPSKLKTSEGLVGLHWGILTYEGKEKHIFPVKSLISFIFLYILLYGIAYFYNKPILKVFSKNIRNTEYVFMIGAFGIAAMLALFYKLYTTVMPLFQLCFTLLAIYAFFECTHKYVQLRYAKLARTKILAGKSTIHANAFVSILVAAKDESSAQIIKTLESLISQTHKRIEILYIDNNSKDKVSFDEVSKHFKNIHSDKLKLVYEKSVKGYKAGALNLLLKQISTEAEFVAVIDSDYIVDAEWITTALAYAKKDTGFVQFPQAYHLGADAYREKNIIEIGSAVEQSYVFDVVYPVRSFIGDVVQNGTMVMISKKHLGEGWPTYSICEDAALGLVISKQGGKSVFVPQVMGKGAAPKTFSALRKQRNRWVFGAIQILQRGILRPRALMTKTYFLFLIDWLGWIMQGLYPILLFSSLGYIVFLWLVYLHLQISWVMLVGFIFVVTSLILFIMTYLQTYKHNKNKFLEMCSLLLVEFSLVNTISKTVLSGLVSFKAKFVTTRQIGSVKVSDLIALIISAVLIWFGVFLYIILYVINIPLSVKLLGMAQLSVVMIPQFSYLWLRIKY